MKLLLTILIFIGLKIKEFFTSDVTKIILAGLILILGLLTIFIIIGCIFYNILPESCTIGEDAFFHYVTSGSIFDYIKEFISLGVVLFMTFLLIFGIVYALPFFTIRYCIRNFWRFKIFVKNNWEEANRISKRK